MARPRWTISFVAAGLMAGLGGGVVVAPALATQRPAAASSETTSAVTSSGIQPGDWTSYRNRAGKGAFNQAENVLTAANVSTLHPIFTIPTGTFLLRAGQVGGTGHGMLYTRSSDDTESMSAYDLSTGALRWTSYPGGNQLVVGDSAVYSISEVEQLGPTGNITARDAMTGAVLWNIPLTTINGTSPPVLSGNTLVVSYTGVRRGVFTGFVRAINVKTGKQIWRKRFAGDLTGASAGAGSVFVTINGVVTALNLDNGRTRWTLPGQAVDYTPVFSDDTVYVAARSGRVVAMNAATGGTRWSATLPAGSSVGQLALANGIVFATSSPDDFTTPDLFAYNSTTGALRWSTRLAYGTASPTVAGNVLYVNGLNGSTPGLKMLNPTNGQLISSYPLDPLAELRTELMVSHGRVYFASVLARAIVVLGP